MKVFIVVAVSMLMAVTGCQRQSEQSEAGAPASEAMTAQDAAAPAEDMQMPAGDTAMRATDADGTWCGDPGASSAGKVFIEISYPGDGTPSASPESCTVKRGTKVTWRGPEGSPVVFTLDFPSGLPAQAPDLGSHGMGRQKVVIVASNRGDFKYGIRANDKHRDPSLIVTQ